MQNDPSKKEMVDHPDHYNNGNPAYEPYKVIREWGCNFNIGSAIKYLSRYMKKWNPIEDLEKAIKYIEFEIDALKNRAHATECDCKLDGECEETDDVDIGFGYAPPCEREGKPMDEIMKDLGLDGKEDDDEDEEPGNDEDWNRNQRIAAMREILQMTEEEINRVLGMSDDSENKTGNRVERRVHRYTNGSSTPPCTRFTQANF